GSPERRRVRAILDAAAEYFENTLIQYVVQLRGRAPAASLQPDFEADVLYAAELWDAYTDGRFWPRLAPVLRDACDGYYWCDSHWSGLFDALHHDHGTASPDAPGLGQSALAAGAADLLAMRTQSMIAGWYAGRPAPVAVRNLDIRQVNRLWQRIVYDRGGSESSDPFDAPLARNLDNGWIVMRSNWRPGATVVTFDAGQPYWLNRQHYDAGQFQIIRKGRLAPDSGDDVLTEAVPVRGGRQGIGAEDDDFERYAAATVAHNCLLIRDPRNRLRMARRGWRALGNQRLIDGDWTDVASGIDGTDRQTGRLIAFETNAYYSYAACDLAPAYDAGAVHLYDRHLLFVGGRWLFVLDRVVTARPDIVKTWLLHLPNRPLLDGRDMDSQYRRKGDNNAAGVWQPASFEGWLSTDAGDGRLYVRTLLPEQRRWHLVGGPQRRLEIEQGAGRGTSYVGGEQDGFEYRLQPASAGSGSNAWFRLGKPLALGRAFGVGSNWGRLEVEPMNVAAEHSFVHMLVPVDRRDATPPEVDVRLEPGRVRVTGRIGANTYEVTLSPRGPDIGRVVVTSGTRTVFDQRLTKTVQPNPPIRVHK
ncbi:MAG: heparinase II/III family protein, partial [Phycisphaerae bacterium]